MHGHAAVPETNMDLFAPSHLLIILLIILVIFGPSKLGDVGGGLGKAIDRLVVERMNEQNLVHSLESLKMLAEQTSAVSHSY